MPKKSLQQTNPYLKAADTAMRARRVRTLASSTAIETNEPIQVVEAKLISKKRYRVTLA